MERNIGEILISIENDLTCQVLVNNRFDDIVLTPLLMDFWNEVPEQGIYYVYWLENYVPNIV